MGQLPKRPCSGKNSIAGPSGLVSRETSPYGFQPGGVFLFLIIAHSYTIMVKDGDVQKRRVIVSIAETDVSKVRWTKEKAELLSQWKREMGCSLQAIADAGGYSKTAIAKIVAGEWEEVDYESIKVISSYLGHSYSELGQVITTSIPE